MEGLSKQGSFRVLDEEHVRHEDAGVIVSRYTIEVIREISEMEVSIPKQSPTDVFLSGRS